MDFPWNSFSLPRREERRHPWSKASWRWGDRQSNDRVQGACWVWGQRQLDAQRKPHQDRSFAKVIETGKWASPEVGQIGFGTLERLSLTFSSCQLQSSFPLIKSRRYTNKISLDISFILIFTRGGAWVLHFVQLLI